MDRLAETSSLLRRVTANPGESVETEDEALTAESAYARIRCPHCLWQPTAASRWWCADCDWPEFFYGGCNTEWNTFDTAGVCPGCSHQWRWTACLRCHGWAKHEDWYEKNQA
jgi:hypothetical protein